MVDVAGIVTIPRSVYLARSTSTDPAAGLLLDSAARTAFVGARLAMAMRQPATGPATAHLAQLVLEADAAEDICRSFAEKALETLRDVRRHDRSVVVAITARFAVTFVAWNGTCREVRAERYGTYLPSLWATATGLTQMVPEIGGFLEIDSFVRDEVNDGDLTAPASSTFEIYIEYSHLPGNLVGGVAGAGRAARHRRGHRARQRRAASVGGVVTRTAAAIGAALAAKASGGGHRRIGERLDRRTRSRHWQYEVEQIWSIDPSRTGENRAQRRPTAPP